MKSNCSGADYLLKYYELKKSNAEKSQDKKSQEKFAEIQNAISVCDIEGKPPLLLACKNINENCVLRLLKLDINKVTINIADTIEYRTPLHIACILGLSKVAELLLQLGADKELTDKHGHKPFYYLTCEENEKKEYISGVLDSVNFFFGRYFDDSDRESVSEELISASNTLRDTLSSRNLIQNIPILEAFKRQYEGIGLDFFIVFLAFFIF